MKALIVSDLADDFAGVALQDVKDPKVERGQLLVKIHAAALGFPDLLMTHGGYQMKPNLPFTPGMEGAGEVIGLGEGVSDWALGDRVVIGGLGTMAEQICIAAATARKIPDTLDYATAASLGSAYLTAYVALHRRAALQAGEWLLVHGAAGGVGLAAVDLARHMGAKIIATASSAEKLQIINDKFSPQACLLVQDGFREKVKELTNGGADVIYDPVGGDVFDESVRCIGWGGRLLVVGFAAGRIPDISVNMALIKGFSVVGVRAGEYGRRDPEKGAENLSAIWDMAAKGEISPHVHNVLALSDWRDAFELMRNRQLVGRVVLNPSA
jgi:NADPH2:quinone reductase